VGAVVIGRNEGLRLERCLASLRAQGVPVVYVDSGSTDESVAAAGSAGAEVVELDLSRPFTAARARNAGFARLLRSHPELRFVQLVDGDCEVSPGWVARAAAFLDGRAEVAAVVGRLLERRPEESVYNLLCSLEWQKPTGEIKACTGTFMTPVQAFQSVDGFNEDVPAAEDDDLCLRLRAKGWRIWAIEGDMAVHDAHMTRFAQWWLRAKRTGYAYAQGASLHGKPPERHFVRDCRRIWFWALIVPMLALAPAWWTRGWSLLLLLGYPALAAKVYFTGLRRGWPARSARWYAIFTVLAKWPGLLGMIEFHRRRLAGRSPLLIEYKEATQGK
jgi:GT2 family glycosyltransferase